MLEQELTDRAWLDPGSWASRSAAPNSSSESGQGDGSLLAFERLPVDPPGVPLASSSRSKPRSLLCSTKPGWCRRRLKAIGIGFGGPVDSGRGRIQKSYQIEGWDDFPLADWIREHLGVSCCVRGE